MNWKGVEESDYGLILRYFPDIDPKGPRETMKTVSLDSRRPSWYSWIQVKGIIPWDNLVSDEHIPSWIYPDYIHMIALHWMTLRWQPESPVQEWDRFLMFWCVSRCRCSKPEIEMSMLDSSTFNFNFLQLCNGTFLNSVTKASVSFYNTNTQSGLVLLWFQIVKLIADRSICM
jgi:hypothetical protein